MLHYRSSCWNTDSGTALSLKQDAPNPEPGEQVARPRMCRSNTRKNLCHGETQACRHAILAEQ